MDQQGAASRGERVRGDGLWLGLDTGGTFTDAVLLDGGRRVVASAKSLTTHWDLSLGIGGAIRAVLAALPGGARREDVTLVSVSTTLATNAVVENRFSPVCSLLIGFDEPMLERSGLRREGAGFVVQVPGGHDATGDELEPLDEVAVEAAVREHGERVEGFAVAARFSVRNPAHELRARQLIRALSRKPVTCAHELSSKLDAPRRALTAALNARLTPQIRHLIEALSRVLEAESVDAPLMIVKGDGSLMRSDVALEYPVETILSGPAASVVGAGFLTGLSDFIVSDMGGTTTDVAVVTGGRPVINAEGALVGGWRTMVEAVDMRTIGLGGDSEVHFDRDLVLRVGPRKAMPLSLLAHQVPELLADLRALATLERLPDFPTQFALRTPGREAPAHLTSLERRVYEALGTEPRRASVLVRNAAGLQALRRLADAGLATLASFTPSDAMHVLGRQHGWSVEAAELGARLLAVEERNARGAKSAASAQAICERTLEHVIADTGRIVLATALAHDPGLEARGGHWGLLGDRLVADAVGGRPFSALLRASLALATPLVAIGAPVGAYYPEVARRLGAPLSIPEHAAVCNAVGAVAGVVSQTVEVLVNQPTFKVFRVHDPAGTRDYADAEPAIEHARRLSRELALAAALRAGAIDPHVETTLTEKRAQVGGSVDYLAEAVLRSTATGRPFAGHPHATATHEA
ncbi:MAG TPA: hydantoinase/oxoprolinase family protein [Steroidobacteraceae bacterium]|nr:hydantoinase/oxoprolinase family protein [Steroidobacteraceae bacterium]